jgi:hypothetical protein
VTSVTRLFTTGVDVLTAFDEIDRRLAGKLAQQRP